MSVDQNKIMGVRSSVVFWTVFAAVLVPSTWFVGSSYLGLQDILAKLHVTQSSQTVAYFKEKRPIAPSDLMIRAHLEYDTLWNRQGRTISFLATRTWLRFMSSVFGAILIFVGSIYLLCRIEASRSEMNGKYGELKVSLITSSPGIIMLIVGAALMMTPNIVDQPIETFDPTYVPPVIDSVNALESRPSETPYAENILKNIEEDK